MGWLRENFAAVIGAVFAVGVAFDQLAHLSNRLDATIAEMKELRHQVVEMRVAGVGVTQATLSQFAERQRAVDARQTRELDRVAEQLLTLSTLHAGLSGRLERLGFAAAEQSP